MGNWIIQEHYVLLKGKCPDCSNIHWIVIDEKEHKAISLQGFIQEKKLMPEILKRE